MRELKNFADYFSFLDKPVIEYEDLPPGFFSNMAQQDEKSREQPAVVRRRAPSSPDPGDPILSGFKNLAGMREEAYRFVLETIREYNRGRKAIGREELARCSRERNLALSVYEIREMMSCLKEGGYITVQKGRGGSRITERGQYVLEKLPNKLNG